MTIVEEANSEPFQIENNTAYKARSNKDRWLDSYRLAEHSGFTGGGNIASDAAALSELASIALATGRGELILPRGEVMAGDVSILNPGNDATEINGLRIVAQGPDATWVRNTHADQAWFEVGQENGGQRTSCITFEGFSCVPAVAMSNAGSVFRERNTYGIKYKSIIMRAVRNGWDFGAGATIADSSKYPSMTDCGGTSAVEAPPAEHEPQSAPMIRLGSCSSLRISGSAERWNAVGYQAFITHDDPNWNTDGLYVYGQHLEHWWKTVSSCGKGIVNFEWTGGQTDRCTIFFHADPNVATGSNRNWNIHDTQILGFPVGGAIGVLVTKGNSTSANAVQSIKVKNNEFDGLSDCCIYAPNGEVIVSDNTMINCANWGGGAPSGGGLIRVGYGLAHIHGNIAYRPSGSYGNPYRNGIQFDGAAHPRQKHYNNEFYDYGNAPVIRV